MTQPKQAIGHRVGTKGQVVIPKEIRHELGIESGDAVVFWVDGDHVVIQPRSRPALKGLLAGHDLVSVLARERAAERRRESAR